MHGQTRLTNSLQRRNAAAENHTHCTYGNQVCVLKNNSSDSFIQMMWLYY
jgi:hypothetical protein